MNSDRYEIVPINSNNNSELDIIFIHGLGGDRYTTWQNANNESWQDWLAEDFNVSIWTIGYGANPTNWIEDDMSLDSTADYFLSLLKSKGIGKKPYMFIVHSLGGLLVKKILLKSKIYNEYEELSTMCKSIVFFGVPHTGSGWANILNYAKTLFRSSRLLNVLSKNTDYLHQLSMDFNGLINSQKIETYVFYETKEIRASGILGWLHLKKGIIIVNQESATNVHSKNHNIPLPKDHISICKIDNRDNDLYKNRIKDIVNKMIVISEQVTQEKQQSNETNNSSSITQTHYGSGDIIAGDKVTHNNNSVNIGGSNSGSVVIGNNNKVRTDGR